jgi:hypothetical protein
MNRQSSGVNSQSAGVNSKSSGVNSNGADRDGTNSDTNSNANTNSTDTNSTNPNSTNTNSAVLSISENSNTIEFASNSLLPIRIHAPDEIREKRGWVPDVGKDAHSTECDLDDYDFTKLGMVGPEVGLLKEFRKNLIGILREFHRINTAWISNITSIGNSS